MAGNRNQLSIPTCGYPASAICGPSSAPKFDA